MTSNEMLVELSEKWEKKLTKSKENFVGFVTQDIMLNPLMRFGDHSRMESMMVELNALYNCYARFGYLLNEIAEERRLTAMDYYIKTFKQNQLDALLNELNRGSNPSNRRMKQMLFDFRETSDKIFDEFIDDIKKLKETYKGE